MQTTKLMEHSFERDILICDYEKICSLMDADEKISCGSFKTGDVSMKFELYPRGLNSNSKLHVSVSAILECPHDVWVTKVSIGVRDSSGCVRQLFSTDKKKKLSTSRHFVLDTVSLNMNWYFPQTKRDAFLSGGTFSLQISGSCTELICESVEEAEAALAVNDDFASLYGDNKLSDIQISVSGVLFPLHTIVLWLRCPALRTRLEESSEDRSKVLSIEEIDAEVFKEVVRFIYTGKCPQINSMGNKLMQAAIYLEYEELKLYCQVHLQKYM